jgi:hypothetical protein
MKDTWSIRFNLTTPSSVNAYAVTDGATVEVHKNSPDIDVTGLIANEEEDAIATARFSGDIFLNKLSWGYGRHLEIACPTRVTHILPSGQEDVKNIEPQIMPSGSIELRITDPFGNVVADSTELSRIEVRRSQAAFYYRRAHLAFDPFDKFRNFYLAAENIADRIRIKKELDKKDVGNPYEQKLLELALRVLFGDAPQPLSQIAKTLPDFDNALETIPAVAKVLFKGYRCQLNHSKASESKRIPFNPQDEKEVKNALPVIEFLAKSLLDYEETHIALK